MKIEEKDKIPLLPLWSKADALSQVDKMTFKIPLIAIPMSQLIYIFSLENPVNIKPRLQLQM